MIVRNEAHVVHEVLDCVASYIDYWVIVDTGSDDGTQDVIRDHLAKLGIPGELHDRPWRNFGANRTEALDLAQGRSDYIWVMDADDLVVGELDLSALTGDAYELRFGTGFTYWRPQIFKDGLPWSYRGVVHEYLHCDAPFTRIRLEGEYHLESRRLGNRSADPEKYARDRDLLLAELERNPDDERSVFYLAQSYFDYGDFESALTWYRRRAEMGRWVEEVYYSLYRVAECLARLDEPWPVVLDAYLAAWANRPTRAEPLCAIANRYMNAREWALGHLFAERAARIPMPEDILFVRADVYEYSALDIQAVCASWLGLHDEAFSICRKLIALERLDDVHKARIASNRDFSVPALLEAAAAYPEALVRSLCEGFDPGADVTVTVVAGPDAASTERTLNSVLNCCSDLQMAGRFVLLAGDLSEHDRSRLAELYPFCEPLDLQRTDPAHVRQVVTSRFWLHVPSGWQFFAPSDYLTRLTGILGAAADVDQVGINLGDATEPGGSYARSEQIHRSAGTGNFVAAETPSHGPAMFDTTRLRGDECLPRRPVTLDEVVAVRVTA